jgi:hypothetical protein
MVHSFSSQNLRKIVDDAVAHFVKAPVIDYPPSPFSGGGVYALYYLGDFPLYKDLKITEVEEDSIPIYVGKANPSGWRTARITAAGGRKLYGRVREHYRNVVAAENLEPDDFKVKCMVLDGDEAGLIGPVEAALIRKFEPLWNTMIDGFGNHTPGVGRFEQAKSGWDVLHPGRAWADRCKGKPPAYDDLVARIKTYAG